MDRSKERWQIIALHGVLTLLVWTAATAALFSYDHPQGVRSLGFALLVLITHIMLFAARLDLNNHERVEALEYSVKNLRQIIQDRGSPEELSPLLPLQTNKT